MHNHIKNITGPLLSNSYVSDIASGANLHAITHILPNKSQANSNAKTYFLLSRKFLAKLINHSSIQALCIPFCQGGNTKRFLFSSTHSFQWIEESIKLELIYWTVSWPSSITTANELITSFKISSDLIQQYLICLTLYHAKFNLF